MKNELPQIMNPVELIKWCRGRKQTLGLSNTKLAELTGVPIGTIDRIMSGNYTEFKYSSVQPLIAALIGYAQDTPEPNEDNEQEQFYYETIEGYKLIMENKNHEIETLAQVIETRKNEIAFLKLENERKQEIIEKMSDHIKWLTENFQPPK